RVARAVTARKLLNLPWLLPLPSKERSRTARCARPSSALRAPSPASGRRVEAVPGAQAGVCFLCARFLCTSKEGGSRRHGAKAFDLDVGGRAAGQDPPYGAVTGNTEEQERLAALAPSSGASRHLLPQAGEGLFGCSPASGRRAVRLLSRKREEGCLTALPQREKGCLAALPQAGEGVLDRCSRQREKGCAVRPRSAAGRQERGGPGVQQLLRDVDPDRLGPRRIAGALRAHGHAVVGRADQALQHQP